jgi:hypothetical protein
MLKFEHDNGGKTTKGRSGNCGPRAVAIATGRPYKEVLKELNEYQIRSTGGMERSCNSGTALQTIHQYMSNVRGWTLFTEKDAGKTLYFTDVPNDRMVLVVTSNHYCAVDHGTIRDLWDCQKSRRTKNGSRKILGYYRQAAAGTL